MCNILLRLDESNVKKFLQCLSETNDYEPHKQLLEKIQCKHLRTTVANVYIYSIANWLCAATISYIVSRVYDIHVTTAFILQLK